MLFLRSMQDELVPVEQMEELMNRAEGARFKMEHRIYRGRIYMNWEIEPEVYFGKYEEFFRRVEGQGIDQLD